MPVKINSFDKITKRLKIQENGPAQAVMTEACYKYMDEFVPMDNGDLRANVELSTNEIVYASPYASYQYFGKRKDNTHVINPENYTTPGTGPYWDKRMKSARMQEVVKEVQDFINRGGK